MLYSVRFHMTSRDPGILLRTLITGQFLLFSVASDGFVLFDDLMRELAGKYPYYGWEKNVGYPTKQHREGIREHGVSPFHRRSFQLIPKQLELFDKN